MEDPTAAANVPIREECGWRLAARQPAWDRPITGGGGGGISGGAQNETEIQPQNGGPDLGDPWSINGD